MFRVVGVCMCVMVGLAGVLGCAAENVQSVEAQEADTAASPPTDLYAGSPYLRELRNSLVYGEIWERPQLSKRDRSLITIAVLQALAREELAHFREVLGRLEERGVALGHDEPDSYMTSLHKMFRRKDSEYYLLDRLLVFGLVEARGCERFYLLGEYLPLEKKRKLMIREKLTLQWVKLRLNKKYNNQEKIWLQEI